MKKVVFVVFILLFMSIAGALESVSPVVAQEIIYIKAGGRVDPATAPIYRDGNLYTFTDNIFDRLVVERDNIVVNGAGFTLQGKGSETGIYLNRRSNVSIQNMYVRDFEYGIYIRDSSSNSIHGNQITNNDRGIYLYKSSSNSIHGNQITNNQDGIYLRSSTNNFVIHNNFIDNSEQVIVRSIRVNIWDNGEEGNHWSDYPGGDSDGDGIGDTPYIIDDLNNIDYHPLMNPWIPPPDTALPIVSIISPENKTYSVTTVPLIFIVSESTSWINYSLDGQATVTIAGNTNLKELSEGTHSLVVYAKDMAGNFGSSPRVYFTIDTTLPDTISPTVSILSPENKTYDTVDTPLTFTVDETVSWMAYSLDEQANVTITEDITLYGLTNGTHSLIFYAQDEAGNTGTSEKIYFTIEPKQAGPTQLWIVAVITVIAGVGFAFTGYLAYYLLKTSGRNEPRHRSKRRS